MKSLVEFISTEGDSDDLILDFFSGSATTAHAVMAQNAEDGGNRKFIMVQLAEETPEGSEASKAGYRTIAELGRERIRRAAAKIKADCTDKLAERETPLDTGFRAYRVDSSNMLDVHYHPSEVAQADLSGYVDNIKDDRTPEDLLTQVMLDLGLTLDLAIEEKQLGNHTVFCVGGNSLVACLEPKIDFAIVDDIAAMKPLKVVFRDSSFQDDKDRINVETRIHRHSPDTDISVL